MKKSPHRQSPSVNAGSMADIAFLLLIFFLVTTTIASDQGVLVKLPPWADEPPVDHVYQRNIFRVSVNANDELLVLGEEIPITILKERVKDFILNPDQKAHLSSRPNAAVVSLIHDRSTTYTAYLSVYNELKMAYNEIWETQANTRFQQNYASLSQIDKTSIHKQFPLVISEAEPTDYMR